MTRWVDALDVQLEIYESMVSQDGREFGRGYFASAYKSPTQGERRRALWTSEQDAARYGEQWTMEVGASLFNADPVYVDPDMMTVVEAAVQTFEPEAIRAEDLIVPTGLLILPRHMNLVDEEGRTLTWSIAFWRSYPDGLHLVLFHDSHAPDDFEHTDRTLRHKLGWNSARYLPTHVTNWTFGELHPGHDVAVGKTAHTQVQATWRLLVQHLADPARMRPPRAFLKRAQRARMTHENVVVVRLRRPPEDHHSRDAEPTSVQWSRRWVVGGHWRNQWYPSLGLHRQIWISPFVKGPDDAPLVVSKGRVFALVR